MSDWFTCPDGTRLHVREDGDPDAPVTVVLVHCYALDLRVWEPVVELLVGLRPLRILRFDHRGHGGSDPASPHTDVSQLGDDLACLIRDRVPTGPVVLVGHSLGGMTVMALADRHPRLVEERVAGVALLATSSAEMSTASLGLPRPLGTTALWLERRGMDLLAALDPTGLPVPRALLGPLTRWLGFGSEARPADVDAVSALAAGCRLGGIAGLRRTIDEHDCRLALVTFDGLPAVVMVGDEDRLTPVRHAAVIAHWLPHARLLVLPGAGHMLPWERSTEVVDVLDTLVGRAVAEWQDAVAAGWRPAA